MGSKQNIILARRDLFDARFQLMSSDSGDAPTNEHSDLDFLEAPSDLVPGIYEGGLKTWECSLDLVDCLESIHGSQIGTKMQGKRVIEVRSYSPHSRGG